MDEAIRFILGNFTLTFLVIGLAAWLVSLLRTSKPRTLATVIRSAALLFPDVRLQLSLQLHPAHFFRPHMIGWSVRSRRRLDLQAWAFSAVGLMACWCSFDLWFTAIVGLVLFLLGAAGGHIYQIVNADNAPGNAGVILYTDILIPLIAFALLWLQHR
jgi:hypothetical protein